MAPMLTVKEAAALLGISPALVYALVAARKVRHERHGLGRGAIRIPEDALEEYCRRHTIEATEEETRPVVEGKERGDEMP
ncbi:MAG: helix-turn-helix domain-containing protein [Gemmataceae bacterium]